MKGRDVYRMFLSRRENYAVTSIKPLKGRAYEVIMGNERYHAVVLISSFEFYEKRYHLATSVPTLVICFEHNTVLPVSVLSLRAGNLARPYELPETIRDVASQRASKTGSRVLLGMYISGLKSAQALVNSLPITTRKRYLQKVEALGKRRPGKPVAVTLVHAQSSG